VAHTPQLARLALCKQALFQLGGLKAPQLFGGLSPLEVQAQHLLLG
jgi:hypothetical protein